MKVRLLEHDGRCLWLDKKVLKGLYPEVVKNARNPVAKKQYVVVDWISNDDGKVGVDLKWFKTMGVPAVQSFKNLPKGNNYAVINTGYDSIVHEEKFLRENGVQIIDEPCPFIRRVRKWLENANDNYQYVLLCEPNHIIIKNFSSIFPKDMILVQMGNYKERIKNKSNGKPIMLIPYVTFLPRHVTSIMAFLAEEYPGQKHEKVDAACMWIKSTASPIVEINNINDEELEEIDTAVLLSGPATSNKSLLSLFETLEENGLQVEVVTSFKEYKKYEKQHPDASVLLVRSPVPNNTEKEVMAYINKGDLSAMLTRITNNSFVRMYAIGVFNKMAYGINWIKYKLCQLTGLKIGREST